MKNTILFNANPDTRFVYRAGESNESPTSKGKELVRSITVKEKEIIDAENSKTESVPEEIVDGKTETKAEIVDKKAVDIAVSKVEQRLEKSPIVGENKDKIQAKLDSLLEQRKTEIDAVDAASEKGLVAKVEEIKTELAAFEKSEGVKEVFENIEPFFEHKDKVLNIINLKSYGRKSGDWALMNERVLALGEEDNKITKAKIKGMQLMLGVEDDGLIGPETIKALGKMLGKGIEVKWADRTEHATADPEKFTVALEAAKADPRDDTLLTQVLADLDAEEGQGLAEGDEELENAKTSSDVAETENKAEEVVAEVKDKKEEVIQEYEAAMESSDAKDEEELKASPETAEIAPSKAEMIGIAQKAFPYMKGYPTEISYEKDLDAIRAIYGDREDNGIICIVGFEKGEPTATKNIAVNLGVEDALVHIDKAQIGSFLEDSQLRPEEKTQYQDAVAATAEIAPDEAEIKAIMAEAFPYMREDKMTHIEMDEEGVILAEYGGENGVTCVYDTKAEAPELILNETDPTKLSELVKTEADLAKLGADLHNISVEEGLDKKYLTAVEQRKLIREHFPYLDDSKLTRLEGDEENVIAEYGDGAVVCSYYIPTDTRSVEVVDDPQKVAGLLVKGVDLDQFQRDLTAAAKEPEQYLAAANESMETAPTNQAEMKELMAKNFPFMNESAITSGPTYDPESNTILVGYGEDDLVTCEYYRSTGGKIVSVDAGFSTGDTEAKIRTAGLRNVVKPGMAETFLAAADIEDSDRERLIAEFNGETLPADRTNEPIETHATAKASLQKNSPQN